MPDYSSSLAKAVQERRASSGMTQDNLAMIADTNSRTILEIENGRGNPRLETLFPLIRALRIDANAVFYPELESGNKQQRQLQLEFAECSDEEAEMLLGICRAALTTMRSKEFATIK